MNKRARAVVSFAVALAGLSCAAQGNAQTYGRIQQTDAAIVYEGSWQTIAEPTASGGTMAVSNQPGASATLTFTGTGAAWIGYKCPCAGIARRLPSMPAALCTAVPTSFSLSQAIPTALPRPTSCT